MDYATTQSQDTQYRAIDVGIAFAAATALAAAVALTIRPSAPVSPLRVAVLNDIIAGRSIAYTPYPVGYIAFAAVAIRWFGMRGLAAAQGALYVATVLLAYATLCTLRVSNRVALAGALAVAVYPNMLFAITRFMDTGPSCFLLSAFAYLVVRLKKDGLSTANAAIGGTLFGLMLLVRPNTLTLAPIAVWAAFAGRGLTAVRLARLLGASVLALGIAAAVVVPLKGRFVLFDRYNAAYTLANGTHEHALEGMRRDYNGEMAMAQSIRELGLPIYGMERSDPVAADQYMRVAWNFIREHPFRYAVLEAFKVVNLFRPDYRNVNQSVIPPAIGRTIHTVITALFFAWAALRWRCRHFYGLGDGLILIPMLVFYFAPFVATQADPRYRIPIDVLFIVDCAFCLSMLKQSWDARAGFVGRAAPRAATSCAAVN
jgi:hypothetical protein